MTKTPLVLSPMIPLCRSVRRASNNQSERWNISRFFAPSTALEEDLELEEEVPIEEEVEEDGRLEEEEQEERGRSASSLSNYLVYLRACGVGMGLSYLLCAVAGQGEDVKLILFTHDAFSYFATLSLDLFLFHICVIFLLLYDLYSFLCHGIT